MDPMEKIDSLAGFCAVGTLILTTVLGYILSQFKISGILIAQISTIITWLGLKWYVNQIKKIP